MFRLKHLWYRIKCFLWFRYTTIKPRYLDHTYCDVGDLIPHMMFELLSRFIEEDCSPGYRDWYTDYDKIGGKFKRDILQDLYDWWHSKYNKEYPEALDILYARLHTHWPTQLVVDGFFNPQYKTPEDKRAFSMLSAAITLLEDKRDRELETNMQTLLTLRKDLWT